LIVNNLQCIQRIRLTATGDKGRTQQSQSIVIHHLTERPQLMVA